MLLSNQNYFLVRISCVAACIAVGGASSYLVFLFYFRGLFRSFVCKYIYLAVCICADCWYVSVVFFSFSAAKLDAQTMLCQYAFLR